MHHPVAELGSGVICEAPKLFGDGRFSVGPVKIIDFADFAVVKLNVPIIRL